MIINYDGRDYHVDIDEIDIDEYRQLKTKYGMTPKAFQEGINEGDPDASTFLYWIMLRRDGQAGVPLGNQLKPNVTRLNAAMVAAVQREEAEEAERKKAELAAEAGRQAAAVPTRPAGPPSPEPGSPPAANRASQLRPVLTETASSPDSGTATSAPSATSTSSSSPGSADSTHARSEG